MSEINFLVEEAVEGGYDARAIGESIFTQADDLEELNYMIRDAVRCHFDDGEMPELFGCAMKKKFDAVKYQREIRKELGKKYLADREGFLRELNEKYGHLKKQRKRQMLDKV